MLKHKAVLILIFIANPLLAKTELFTLEELPFVDKDVEVCYLDFTKKALAKINKELQPVINDADIDKVLNPHLMQEIASNLQCRFKASSIAITKAPAIVIDDKITIYGMRSIKQAYDLAGRINNG